MNYKKGRRLRLFGGPNGSGKSTILNQIRSNFDVGKYVNADEIELDLVTNGFLDLKQFGIQIDNANKFKEYVKNHSITKKAISEGWNLQLETEKHKVIGNASKKYSYEAALIADFVRWELLKNGSKLTFETVMSHSSKLDILDYANENGYKTYLYFICTASPEINVERVNLRVKEGGHRVDEARIVKRYYESLKLLRKAVQRTYRAFIWDNSQRKPRLILEIYRGKEATILNPDLPAWIDEFLIKK